jgi:Holliday junction DNA helicase RuvB
MVIDNNKGMFMQRMAFKVISGEETPPVSMDELDFSVFIGQDEVLSKVRFYISAHNVSAPFPTLLFTGSHGLGKTYMASLTANNMQRRFCELNASMIRNERDFIETFVMGYASGLTPVTILIDECHKLPTDVMTALLTILNPSNNPVTQIPYKNMMIVFDMRMINFILATTDAYQIISPLKNRCQEVYFRAYRDDELMAMLLFYLQAEESIIQCNKEALIRACRSRGRDTYILAENIIRYWSVYGMEGGNRIIRQEDMNGLFNILGLDEFGLYNKEAELIRVVAEQGPISASNLAIVLMVSEENVKYELEVRPRELGLIHSTSRGRVVTKAGMDYLEDHNG